MWKDGSAIVRRQNYVSRKWKYVYVGGGVILMFYIWTEIVNKWKMVTWILSGYSLFSVLFSFFFFQRDFFLWKVVFLPLVAQMEKNLPVTQEVQETELRSLGWEDPLEKGMASHSSILAWRSPWTEEPGGLQSMGSQRVRHNWATIISFTFIPFVPLGSMAYWFFSWPKCFFLTKNLNTQVHLCQSSSSEVWISEWRGAMFHL